MMDGVSIVFNIAAQSIIAKATEVASAQAEQYLMSAVKDGQPIEEAGEEIKAFLSGPFGDSVTDHLRTLHRLLVRQDILVTAQHELFEASRARAEKFANEQLAKGEQDGEVIRQRTAAFWDGTLRPYCTDYIAGLKVRLDQAGYTDPCTRKAKPTR